MQFCIKWTGRCGDCHTHTYWNVSVYMTYIFSTSSHSFATGHRNICSHERSLKTYDFNCFQSMMWAFLWHPGFWSQDGGNTIDTPRTFVHLDHIAVPMVRISSMTQITSHTQCVFVTKTYYVNGCWSINTCTILTIINDVFEAVVGPDAVANHRVPRVTWVFTWK